MPYRNLGNAEEKILSETIKYGSIHGVSKISTKQLAKQCDCSDFTIFDRFKTKQGLLDAAAKSIDVSIMNKVAGLTDEGKELSEIWDIIFDYCLQHKEESLYYLEYVNTFGFDPTEVNTRASEFLEVARLIFKNMPQYNDHQVLIMWDYITTMVFYYCEKIIHGYIEDTAENKSFIKSMVMKSIN